MVNRDTTLSTEWKQEIRYLRIRLEKSVEELKRLENIGTVDAVKDAFWLTDGTICNGSEFKGLKKKLIEKGF